MSPFSLKPCTLFVAVAMLSACQSLPDSAPPSAEPSTKALFSKSKQSLSYGAKTELVSAIERHLARERYAVSTAHYQASPLVGEGIDKDAESIWTSSLKVSEYKKNPPADPLFEPYRNSGDYLFPEVDGVEVDKTAEPYLRYDDEKSNRTPETVSREVGMSETYQAVSGDIDELQTEAMDCVSGESLVLDELIKDNPKITDQNAKVRQAKKDLKTCQTDFDKRAKELLKVAQGYQKSDIRHLQMCMNAYQKGVNDILKPNRTPKALADADYDRYDVIYEHYRACVNVYHYNQDLEPYEYVENATNQRLLDLFVASKTCRMDALQNPALHGKNYTQHSELFLQNRFDSVSCIDKHLHEVLDTDELPKPVTSLDELKSREDEQDTLAYDIKYEYTSGKYRGFSGWLKAYRELKASDKPAKDEQTELDLPPIMGGYGGMVAMMLDHLKRTPEQVTAQNLYQYNNTTLTTLTHHNPTAKRMDVLWSYDFESPTATQSVQLPLSFNFGASELNADVSALLPVMAGVAPKHAPLPQDVPNGQMNFKLPADLAQKIPTDVIYGAVQRGVLSAYASLPEQKFTPIDISGDEFAKTVNAKRAIKVELGSKELGKFLGSVAKAVAQELKAYVDAHPERYPDSIAKKSDKAQNVKKGKPQTDKIKKAIDDFATFSTAHRTSDVGGLWQIVEGIAPFSLENVNYIYLDAQGDIIALQNLNTLDDHLQNVHMQTVSQVRYDKGVFDAHILSSQFTNTFAQKPTFDGTTWAKNAIEEIRLHKEAREARDWYEYDFDDEDDSDSVSAEACNDARCEAELERAVDSR